MEYYPQSKKGFVINEEVAEQLGVLEEYLIWENDYDEEILLERFEELHNVLPDRLRSFEWRKGGYVQGLQGFEYDVPYLVFCDDVAEDYKEDWEKLSALLEENDIEVVDGFWSELG